MGSSVLYLTHSFSTSLPSFLYYLILLVIFTLHLTAFFQFYSNLSDAKSVDFGADPDPRFLAVTSPRNAAMIPFPAQNNAGVFQVDFSDASTRYIPFEGTEAISIWQLDLSKSFLQLSYESVSDAILQFRYFCAAEGTKFASKGEAWVDNRLKPTGYVGLSEGLVALFDI